MKRRRVLAGACGVVATVLAGCSSGDEELSPTPTKSPTQSPTPTPEPQPVVTGVTVTQGSLPFSPNPLIFQISYANLDNKLEYRLRATVEFDSDSKSKQVEKIHGHYPGKDGFGLKPPEGTSTDSQFLEYTVELLHSGDVLDSTKGVVVYE